MQDDNQTSVGSANVNPGVQQPIVSGDLNGAQPAPDFLQDTQSQQQPHVVVVSSDSTESAQPIAPSPMSSQPSTPPVNGQMQVGMSASQMGWGQPQKTHTVSAKGLIIKGVIGLVVLGGIFATLVFTNIIALSRFKTVTYTNASGTHYQLAFYTKHTTKTLQSGNPELVSQVSVGGKYPLVLAIDSGPTSDLDKDGIGTCSGSFSKVFDVQNTNLNQQIPVCSFPATDGAPVDVYVAGFIANNQAHIVTISQNLADVDLSSKTAAQQALPKFGLGDTYQNDIKQILASIKVQ